MAPVIRTILGDEKYDLWLARGEVVDRLPQGDPRLRLSSRQSRAMQLLAWGEPPEEVVSDLAVLPELMGRWLASPRFRDALRAERTAPLSADGYIELARGREGPNVGEEDQ